MCVRGHVTTTYTDLSTYTDHSFWATKSATCRLQPLHLTDATELSVGSINRFSHMAQINFHKQFLCILLHMTVRFPRVLQRETKPQVQC